MIYTVTLGITTDINVTLLDTSNNPVSGVAVGAITVTYRKNGGSFTGKTVLAGEWNELGDGIYKLTFTSIELDTPGFFRFLVAGGSFRTYGTDLSVVNDYQSLSQQVIEIKQSLTSKVNISDADTLLSQREIRLKEIETRLRQLMDRLSRAEAAMAALQGG